MLVFYIRHGDPCYDPDMLTPLGKRQAEAAGEWLFNYCRENGIDLGRARIWRSPFVRTRETSEAFNKSLGITDVREDITLTEQQYGLFDSVPYEKWGELYPREFEEYERQMQNYGKFYARLPLGESPFDVAIRVHQFMGTIHRDLDEDGVDTLFVFTHGTTLRAFLLRWFHYSPEWYHEERNPGNCMIREIDGKIDRGYINK